MRERGLTEKQKRFIDFYIETGNATEAARLAGYSEKTAAVIGTQNLIKLNVFINTKLAAKETERIAAQDEVLRFFTSVMRNEEQEEVVVVEGKGTGVSKAKIIKKTMSARDRLEAAKSLAKRYRLFDGTASDKNDAEPDSLTAALKKVVENERTASK